MAHLCRRSAQGHHGSTEGHARRRGDRPTAGIVKSRSIESAQRKVEARNFDIRKQLLEYDDVSNDQRKVIYQQRNAILEAEDCCRRSRACAKARSPTSLRAHVPAESLEEQWDLPAAQAQLANEWQLELPLVETAQKADAFTDDDVLAMVLKAANQRFAAKLEQIGVENFTPFMRMVLLQSIDHRWREHLAALDYLRQGIHLRGYAQKNPKQEYKREAFELFGQLLDAVKMEVTRVLMNVRIQTEADAQAAAEAAAAQADQLRNVTYTHPNEDGSVSQETDPATTGNPYLGVGRNDTCPCGSGKKFKFCHGKLA